MKEDLTPRNVIYCDGTPMKARWDPEKLLDVKVLHGLDIVDDYLDAVFKEVKIEMLVRSGIKVEDAFNQVHN
jgi:hypothetical protein